MSRPKVALCGAGMISGAHGAAARFLQMPVVAVASRTPERADERATQMQSTAVSYEQLPMGADIEFADQVTLREALAGRRQL